MADSVELELQTLLDLANQHDKVADDTRKWGEPPTDWLATFPDTYGVIAHPVHQALLQYYKARQQAANKHADDHNGVADALRKSAAAYHDADQRGGTHVGNAGDNFGQTHGGHTGAAPTGITSPTVPGGPGGPGGQGPVQHVPPVHPATTPTGTQAVGVPGGLAIPGGATAGHGLGHAGAGAQDGLVPAANDNGFGLAGGPGGGGPGGGPVGGGLGSLYNPAGMGSDAGANPYGGGSTPPGGPGPDGGDALPPMMPTPFAAAVAAAKERENEPAHVVNGAADNDLIIARTLLAAVLAVVEDSVVGTAWAVSVMRGPEGAGVFLTSNEGRGWLPAGLFLPREVSSPWLWDEIIDGHGEGSPWEGISDPARVLVEFGLAWGPKAGAQISALASSAPIDPGLRARLNDVPMQGQVTAAYDVDLRVPTPDTADRLALTGPPEALESVAAVPDSAVRSRSIELAADAHARVVRSFPSRAEVASARLLRESILATVRSGASVPRAQWDALREADDLLAAVLMTRRVDPGRVELGALRVDDEAALLRTVVYERRCNELALLLAAEDSTRQTLRDATYAHAQIVEHPQFVEIPATVVAPEPERVARPAGVPGGAVSAPAVSAGPPRGAIGPVSPTVNAPGVAPDPN